ncbi:hypothetical protein ACTMQO_16660 [Escherichia coli]
MNLQQRINKLPQLSSSFSFGKDIDNIHSFIFNETSKDKIEDLLRKWVSGNQPCVFGKLASKKIKGLDFHLSIVNSPNYIMMMVICLIFCVMKEFVLKNAQEEERSVRISFILFIHNLPLLVHQKS